MASLAAFFVLLSLISYIFARQAYKTLHKVIMYGMTVLFITLGILSKENAIMAVPLVLLYDFIFLSRHDKKGFKIRAIIIAAAGMCVFLSVSVYYPLYKAALEIVKIFISINKPPSLPW